MILFSKNIFIKDEYTSRVISSNLSVVNFKIKKPCTLKNKVGLFLF